MLFCSSVLGTLAENFGMKNKWIWESIMHCLWHTSAAFPQQPLCAGPRLRPHTTPGKSHLHSSFLEQHYLHTLKISFCFTGPSPAPGSREDKFYQSSVSKVIKKGTACSSRRQMQRLAWQHSQVLQQLMIESGSLMEWMRTKNQNKRHLLK